ncbi:MAG: glycosyltransferase family A protein [Actinobacteria bacterium]|nr:glycosyltransferase family A protein [Actinomycetota bacterium]
MPTTEPVLVMAFNRPDHLEVLLARLRQVEPTRLYVAIDGPRGSRDGEAAQVQACRDLVASVDWNCDVKTLVQETNLGCGLGVSTAISWFFANEDRGIILEDDIIPDPSFFPYCAELLERYEMDERVFAISGCNFVPPEAQSHPDLPYRFSQVPHIWGWATWRRSWDKHRLDIAGWRQELPPTKLWARAGHSLPASVYWASTFELLARKEVDTWDGQFVLASMVSHQLTATSNVNLIENIGFGETATHTVEDRKELQPILAMASPIAQVPVALDAKADAWTRKHHFRATWRGMLDQADRYRKQRKARAS